MSPYSSGNTTALDRDPYFAPLDGLRAVAVCLVLLHHRVPWAPGGFLGVDVFFALGGFLITTLLLRERARNGRINLRRFYLRRILRLYPALLACVVLTIPLWLWAPAEDGQRGWTASASAATFYYANFVWPHLGPLAHTWSLSIEEQFYLLWPLVLTAALATRSAKAPALLAIASILGAAILRVSLYDLSDTARSAQALYAFTPVRIDSLMIGALGALLWNSDRVGPALGRVASTPGLIECLLAALAVAAFFVNWEDPSLFYGGFTLVAALSTLLVLALAAAPAKRPAIRCLTSKPAVWVGKRAYGIYLYHLPIYLAADALAAQYPGLPGPIVQFAPIALSFGVAALSYRLLEVRFLNFKARFTDRSA